MATTVHARHRVRFTIVRKQGQISEILTNSSLVNHFLDLSKIAASAGDLMTGFSSGAAVFKRRPSSNAAWSSIALTGPIPLTRVSSECSMRASPPKP